MRQRALQMVAIALLLFVATVLASNSFTFKDTRWTGQAWFGAALVGFALAYLAARFRPRSS